MNTERFIFEINSFKGQETTRKLFEVKELKHKNKRFNYAVYRKWEVKGDGTSVIPNKKKWYNAHTDNLFRTDNENEAKEFFNNLIKKEVNNGKNNNKR